MKKALHIKVSCLLGVKGTEVAVVKINREFETEMKVSDSIPGITSLYNFSYER